MHDQSYKMMKEAVEKYLDKDKETHIIDVGSYEYTGSYRTIFNQNPNWKYVGADLRMGPNVDILWDYSIPPSSFDAVISGQTIEHVLTPWTFIHDLNRVCKPRGLCILVAPWRAPVHKAPLDCWRMLPDGAKALMEYGGFEVIEAGIVRGATGDFDNSSHGSNAWGDDTIVIGRKI